MSDFMKYKAPHFPMKERRATIGMFRELFGRKQDDLLVYIDGYQISWWDASYPREDLELIAFFAEDDYDDEISWVFTKQNWRKAKVLNNTITIQEGDMEGTVCIQVYRRIPLEL